MDIEIPDTVTFSTEKHDGKTWEWRNYCFRHAVLRAIQGEQIKLRLCSGRPVGCDDCLEYEKSQSHGS